MKNKFFSVVPLTALAAMFLANHCSAALSDPVTYPGNGGGGGTVANGSLTLQDNGYTVFGTFDKAPGMSFQLDLVIYIDSVAGGFSDTTSFRDNADPARTAISGFNTALNKGSTATFAPGFAADYAIILGVNWPNTGNGLYRLNAGGDGSFDYIASANLDPTYTLNAWSYTFNFRWSDIGIQPGDAHFLKFQSTYLDSSTSRTLESFESLSGDRGFNSVTFGNYNTYGVAPVPEMTTWALTVFGGLFIGRRLISRAGQSLSRRR